VRALGKPAVPLLVLLDDPVPRFESKGNRRKRPPLPTRLLPLSFCHGACRRTVLAA